MEPILLLLYIMTICLSVQGIIVSVDRADYQPQQYSSMLGNGWRPVTGHDEMNINVSHTNKVQRFSAPLHPVIGKLQGHLGTSDKSKPQNRNRPPDFAPPTILGSFSLFNHATTKTREDPLSNLKLLPLETRKYSFLLPANRDHFHSQDPKFGNKVQKPDTRDTASFYSNGLRYSSTASPLASNRPFLYTYNVQQTLQPPDRPAGTFEYQTPNKQYFIPPGIEYAKDFGKNKSNQQYYNQHSHSQNFQPYNPDPNNFYNYNNHPPPYKVTYERNPGYLIHESHEVGYATPSFEMKFKPSYQNYVMPPGVYTSTLPSTEINYLQPRPDHGNEQYLENVVPKLKNSPVNNEVLRKVRPEKNNQQVINSSQNRYVAQGEEDYVYVPPETQQYFRQKITPPVEPTTEKEYETPESISLKHYNDQLARLANQKNRQRIRDQELTKQQELQRQQYDEYSRQEEERRVFEKQQRLKIENEKTRGSTKAPIREEYQEYKVEQNRDSQKVISGHRFPENQEKGVEVYELTVSQQPTVSYQSTTFPPPVYYQSTLSPEQQKYESSPDYWEQHVQYPEESFSSTKIPEPQRQSQRKQPNRGKPQSVSLYPELAPTEAMIPNAEVIESVTDIPVYTTTLPERTRAPTERTRNHRPSGKRRRRPTVAVQDPRNSASKEKQEVVSERRPSRRRPEVGVRPHKNDPDLQTESPTPNQYEKRREEDVVYVTEYPAYYQKIPTESTESATETISFEYVTEPVQFSRINNYEYLTESTRPTRINNYDSTEPTRSTHANNYEYVEPTRPSRIHKYEEQQKIEYVEATTPIPTTSTTTKAPEVSTTTATTSTAKPIHRVRPSRFGNTSRPRFSVKEYKSRLDYKNKISQISTTEANLETTHVKQRPMMDYKKKQQTGEAPVRETTGKYKHVSRASYRTTSTTPSTEDQTNTTYITYTRNKVNKFSPKQRPNNGYLYRSRTTSTTSRSIKQDENTPSARPENLYSSSIRHRPSIMRNKLKTFKEPSEPKDEIEMATEETSFYTHPTSQPESVENQVNEIIDETKVILPNDESNNEEKENSKVEETESTTVSEKSELTDDSMKTESESTPINDLSTPDDKQSDEQLFEKASQSVADLTSSASALYNKPGLFKAVSPSTENRVVSSHLKITTGEPTLPIEAFFHNLSEKV